MKHLIAIIVCGCIFLVHVVIGVALGWEHGGGVIPMMVLLAAMAAAWRAITKEPSSSPGPDTWTIRVHGRLRPMSFKERHLALSALRQLVKEGKLDPNQVCGCPPNGSEFKPLSEYQELFVSGGGDSDARDSDGEAPLDLAATDDMR